MVRGIKKFIALILSIIFISACFGCSTLSNGQNSSGLSSSISSSISQEQSSNISSSDSQEQSSSSESSSNSQEQSSSSESYSNSQSSSASSSNSSSTSSSSSSWQPESKNIVIANSNNCFYKIIVPTLSNNLIDDTVNILSDKIYSATNCQISVLTDSASQTDYEIIIGETSRQESVNAKKLLSARDWIVTVNKNQIIILGGTNYYTALAIDAFIELLQFNGQQLYIEEQCELSYSYATDNTETVYGTIDEKRAQFANPYGRPMISAHRAEHVYSVENSLAGIISATELGADIIEVDLRKTADGHFILCHDETLTNATNVADLAGKNGLPTSHNIKDWTLEQIKQLKLKNSSTNEKVVLLDDIFNIVRGKAIIACDKITTEEDMLAIYDIAVKYRAVDSILFQFTSSFVPYQKAYEQTGIKMLYLYWKNTPEIASTFVQSTEFKTNGEYAISAIQVNTPTTTPADTTVTAKVREKCRIFTNTLNFDTGFAKDNLTSWKTHIDSGITIIQTDLPIDAIALSQKYVSGIDYSLKYDGMPVLWGTKATFSLNLSSGESAYFTTDGTTPTTSSQQYIEQLDFTKTTQIKILVISGNQQLNLTVNVLVSSELYYNLTTNISHLNNDHLYKWTIVQNPTCNLPLIEEGECFCGEKTTKTGEVKHDFSKEWSYNEQGHWHSCSICLTEKSDENNHTFNEGEVQGTSIVYSCACGYKKQSSLLDGIKENNYGDTYLVVLDDYRFYETSAYKTSQGVFVYSYGIFNTSVSNANWADCTNFEFKLNGGEQSFVTNKNQNFGVTESVYLVELLSNGKYKHTVEFFVSKSIINNWSDTASVQLNYAWKTPNEMACILSDIADIRYMSDWGNYSDWHSYHTYGGIATSFNDLLANLYISEQGLLTETAPSTLAVIDGTISSQELSVLGEAEINTQGGSTSNLKGTVLDGDLYLAITITHGNWSNYYSGWDWYKNDNFEFYINGVHTVITFINGEVCLPHHITQGSATTVTENGKLVTVLELYIKGDLNTYKLSINANGEGFGWNDISWGVSGEKSVFVTKSGVSKLEDSLHTQLILNSVSNQRTLATGITYKELLYKNRDDNPVKAYAVEVSAGKGTFYMGLPNDSDSLTLNGNIYQKATVLEEINSAVAKGKNIVAGINADFFVSNGDMGPRGLCIKEGTLLRKLENRPFFAVLKDGTPVICKDEEYASKYEGKNLIQNAFGGRGLLLYNGEVNFADTILTSEFGYTRNPRTAIGIRPDGSVIMLVVDGRNETANGSYGATLVDLAVALLDMGCNYALNFDGGGSSTMITKSGSSFVTNNTPSDGSLRAIANSLLVIPK